MSSMLPPTSRDVRPPSDMLEINLVVDLVGLSVLPRPSMIEDVSPTETRLGIPPKILPPVALDLDVDSPTDAKEVSRTGLITVVTQQRRDIYNIYVPTNAIANISVLI